MLFQVIPRRVFRCLKNVLFILGRKSGGPGNFTKLLNFLITSLAVGRGKAGGLLGGLLQGRNNPGGMGLPGGMGGLGSLISGLNTGRNNQSLGGLLGRLLK